MIKTKTKQEIETLRQGGRILAGILDKICQEVKPGTSTAYLEKIALEEISRSGGRPAFKDYDMGGGIKFPSALCVSINEEVVHGASLPDRVLKSGDIVDLDIGMEWPVQKKEEAEKKNLAFNPYSEQGGFYTDTCRTLPVGKVSSEARKLIDVTREALNLGISKALPGNTLNDIGIAIEDYVRKYNFGIVRDMVGHGLGYMAHEEPNVFHYRIGQNSPQNLVLKPGMVIAIEPMINLGRPGVKVASNGYTILSADSSWSAHFEHSIAILEEGNLILTKL
jgi:methionyl aminopeptidase